MPPASYRSFTIYSPCLAQTSSCLPYSYRVHCVVLNNLGAMITSRPYLETWHVLPFILPLSEVLILLLFSIFSFFSSFVS